MSRSASKQLLRRNNLIELLKENPFYTDEELAEHFGVSVPTIRLDRSNLDIPEFRERIKDIASQNAEKVKSLSSKEMVGELLELSLNSYAKSILITNDNMSFANSDVIRGQYIYSMAESLAMSVIDAKVALVGIANIKYRSPVIKGQTMLAEAAIKKVRKNSYIVWVKINVKNKEVFQGKFILVSL